MEIYKISERVINEVYAINKKNKLFISAIISTNILLTRKIVRLNGINETKNSFVDNTQLSKINFALLAGVGID